jgi:hypothetical protein
MNASQLAVIVYGVATLLLAAFAASQPSAATLLIAIAAATVYNFQAVQLMVIEDRVSVPGWLLAVLFAAPILLTIAAYVAILTELV